MIRCILADLMIQALYKCLTNDNYIIDEGNNNESVLLFASLSLSKLCYALVFSN